MPKVSISEPLSGYKVCFSKDMIPKSTLASIFGVEMFDYIGFFAMKQFRLNVNLMDVLLMSTLCYKASTDCITLCTNF